MYNYDFSDWLSDMQFMLHMFPYNLLKGIVILFLYSSVIALLACLYNTFVLDLADKQDILADKYNDPRSFYDGTYELPRINIAKAVIYANLSYHTFWNAVVMCRFRWWLHKCPQIYFRVNRFESGFSFIIPLIMLFSIAFTWGYIIFLPIMLLRMAFYSKELF